VQIQIVNGSGSSRRLHHQMVYRRSSAAPCARRKENGELVGRLDLERMTGMEGWQPDRKLLQIIEELRREARL
ncbi:MAG TPA: hypothetical protein VGQ55_10075, partial [Pyrinomonadaceae bacterium]|nr:hypothetical protein [Pyrinomonadaceae bacterium]